MGVQGLWQLLNPAGKPVSPTSLEGKVLAVDVSIWLHQTMKGMRDKDGNPLPNAHLQGLFSRVCKLLFYRVRPVFVFDGGVPALKKQTLAIRRERKENIDREKGQSTQKILENLLQSHAVRGVTGDVTQRITVPAKPGGQQDMFELPPLPEVDKGSGDPVDSVARLEVEEDEFEDHRNLIQYYQEEFQNLEDINCESEEFQSLPPEIRHEILTEMKEQRRENALARIAIMPEESEDFSDYQLKKLLKHSKLSSKIESVRKEMNSRVSADITYALGDDYYGEVVEAQRVVSEDAAHYILIKGLTHKQQVAEAERCKARRLVKQKRELKPNPDDKTMQCGAVASLDTVKEEPVEDDETKVECIEKVLSESNDEMCDDHEDKGKLHRREKRGKCLVTRNGLRSVAKKGRWKNRPARQELTAENVEDEVVVTSVQTRLGAVPDTKEKGESPSEQGVSEFVLMDNVDSVNSEGIQGSRDHKPITIMTEVTTPVITIHDQEENDDTITTNQCLKKTAKFTEDSDNHTSDFVSNKTTCAEEKSKAEEDGSKSPQDESSFMETRNRLLTEEEDLLKAKEAKMAALMKSLEKRTQIIQSPQVQRKSSTDSMREKLIQQEEDLMKEKEAKMAALLQSIERRSQLQARQKSVSTQEKTDPDLQSQISESFSEKSHSEGEKKDGKIKCSENKETAQGFLEDVVEIEQRAVSKKIKAKKSDHVASSEQQAASLSSSNSSPFPTLTSDYLEDIEGKLKVGDIEKPASTKLPPKVVPEHQDSVADIDNNGGESTKQAISDISQRRAKRVSSEKPTEKKVKLVPASSTTSDEDEEDEDEGFIEITIDPSRIPDDDDLFPSSIFTSVPEDDTDTTPHPTDKDKNMKKRQVSTSEYDNVEEEDADVEGVEKDDSDKKSNSEDKEDQLSEDRLRSKDEVKPTKAQAVPSVSLGRQESSERGSEASVNEEKETEAGGEEADLSVLSSKGDKAYNFKKAVNSLRDLFDLQRDLATERRTLTLERGKQARLGKTVTEQINLEAQELLQLFGVPYVVSPMEAEAQCAHLELVGLTEGTITDDSDSWLFGARNIYKNFFNQSKYVEFYSSNAVFQRFGMDREKLINIALLCGSDYTPGIPSVGPVRAMEILAEFPGEGLEGLRDFRDWWEDAKNGIIALNQGKVRNKLRTLQLHEGFPSRRVVDAYLKPAVDESEETFTWGLPDQELLQQFAKQKFGWGKQKTDEILQPMMTELTKKTAQGRIHAYFQPENFVRPKTVQSKRLQAALDKFQATQEESGSSSAQSEFESDSESDSASQSESESEDSDGEVEESKNKKSKPTLSASVGRGRGRGSAGRGRTRGGKSKGLEAGSKPLIGRGRGGKSNVPDLESDRQNMEDTDLIGRKREEQSEGMKSEIKIQRGRGGKSDRQHREVKAPNRKTQSEEQTFENPRGRGRGKGGQSIRQQAEEALSRGGRGGKRRGRGSGTRNPRSLVSKHQIVPLMLRDEVCLSESSSSDDDSQGPTAKKQKPNSTLKQNSTHVLVSETKIMGGRKKPKGPNVKQLLPTTVQALTLKRKTTGENAVGDGRRKAAKVVEDESVAAFREALGGDLDPQTMTVDDLGSDFSDG